MSIRDEIKKYILLKTSDLFALFYLITCENESKNFILVKFLSTALLAYYSHEKMPDKKNLNYSLAAHSVGDFLIKLPLEQNVLLSMPAFFLGHILYCKHLVATAESVTTLSKKEIAGLTAFCLTSAAITAEIQSYTHGIVFYAIPFYAIALAATFVLSALQKERHYKKTAAAFLYVFSDILIATNKFAFNIPHSNYVMGASHFIAKRNTVKNNEPENNRQQKIVKSKYIVFA